MAANQPQAEFSFSLGDLIAIARRRFWWFCVPAVLGAAIALVVALVWPAEYEAAAIVVVEAQAVPEALVRSTVVADTESRFGQIRLMLHPPSPPCPTSGCGKRWRRICLSGS